MEKGNEEFIRFIFLNVGHGACTLISLPPNNSNGNRRYGLIDCNSKDALCVKEFFRKPPKEAKGDNPIFGKIGLEFVAITHFDYDHFKGISCLLDGDESDIFAKRVLLPSNPYYLRDKFTSESTARQEIESIYKKIIRPLVTQKGREEGKDRIFIMDAGKKYWDGLLHNSLVIQAIAPTYVAKIGSEVKFSEQTFNDTNLQSGVLRFKIAKRTVLINGDTKEEEWKRILEMMDTPKLVQSSVVTVPHHGGTGNTMEMWLNRLSKTHNFHKRKERGEKERSEKTIAIISCSENSPSNETFKILKETKTKVYCTNIPRVCPQPHCNSTSKKSKKISIFSKFASNNLQKKLKKFAADEYDFSGTVIIDMYLDDSPPLINHVNRTINCWCEDFPT